MSIDDKTKGYERLWQQPEHFFIVFSPANSDTTTLSSEGREYILWEPMPVTDRYLGFDEEFKSIVVPRMIEAGVQVFNAFPDEDIMDEIRANRIDEWVLVKPERPISKSTRYGGHYFSTIHKPTLTPILTMDGTRQLMINEYRKLVKMGIEIWSNDKWTEYRKMLEQNDNLPRWTDF